MTTPPGPDCPELYRPRLLAISGWREGAPVMHLAWPGSPTLWNAIRLRVADRTLRGCRINALHELHAMTREELQLLREVAKPGPAAHPLAWWPEASPVVLAFGPTGAAIDSRRVSE
jgi:hypothetical protein